MPDIKEQVSNLLNSLNDIESPFKAHEAMTALNEILVPPGTTVEDSEHETGEFMFVACVAAYLRSQLDDNYPIPHPVTFGNNLMVILGSVFAQGLKLRRYREVYLIGASGRILGNRLIQHG